MFKFWSFEFIPYIYIFISVTGIMFSRYNFILILLALDFILFSISLLFIYTSAKTLDLHGQIYAFFLLPVAASETALGLALISAFYRVDKQLQVYGL